MSPFLRLLACGVAGVAAMADSAAQAAASPLALSCTGCHQGADAGPMSSLGRLTPRQIADAMRRFREQPQAGAIMPRFMPALSDADIDALAAELGRAVP